MERREEGQPGKSQQGQPKSTLSPRKINTMTFATDTTEQTAVLVDADSRLYSFYINCTIPDVVDTPRVDVSVPNSYTVIQATRKALISFSESLQQKNLEVSQETKNYQIRIAKKTGKPKTDMPCLDDNQKLSEIKINGVCLQPISDDAIKLIVKEPEEHIFTEMDYSRKGKEIVPDSHRPQTTQKSSCFQSIC